MFRLSETELNPAITIWLVPAAASTLAETTPDKAVELLSWVLAFPDSALHWVRQWPLLQRIQIQLQDEMGIAQYQSHWEKGADLQFDVVGHYLQQAFGGSSELSDNSLPQQLLTRREREVLKLMAAGMTNPEIASQLVISVGTVKTHTLSIYRKLDVANRTQAIIRAQEIGLLAT